MAQSITSKDSGLVFVGKFREYGIRVLDGGSSYVQIVFCPWCGQKLPASMRDEWFSRMEALNLEPGDPRIPVEFLNEEWWMNQG
jgi:hypothetical protein